MCCYYCTNFNEVTRGEGDDLVRSVETTIGQCVISPTWEEVTGLHYCAQFREHHPGDCAGFWRRMHKNYQDATNERALRKQTEKKAKALRQKLRALS